MPLPKGYSCLKGRPIGNRVATGSKPHYQVHVSANGVHYRIAVNVQSNDGSEVQYLVRSRFVHPITDSLSASRRDASRFRPRRAESRSTSSAAIWPSHGSL